MVDKSSPISIENDWSLLYTKYPERYDAFARAPVIQGDTYVDVMNRLYSFKGKIVADGTSRDLRKQTQGREIIKVTIEDGDVNDIFKQLQALPNVHLVDILSKGDCQFEVQSNPEKSSRKDIFKLCVDKKWSLTELTPTETKLEDVFRELTMN